MGDLWLVVTPDGPLCVTEDAELAEDSLFWSFVADAQITGGAGIREFRARVGTDLKLGDWCLTVDGIRNRGYYYTRIDKL